MDEGCLRRSALMIPAEQTLKRMGRMEEVIMIIAVIANIAEIAEVGTRQM